MSRKTSARPVLISILAFIVLEGGAMWIMSKNSFFQRAKLNKIYTEVEDKFLDINSDIRYYLTLNKSNEALAIENSYLRNSLAKYQSLLDTLSIRDSIAARLPDSSLFLYIPARVISNSTNKSHNYLILNKGRKAGVKADMGVISANGVVGVVNAVSENYSHVISLLNIKQSVSARIKGSDAFGPLMWNGVSVSHAVLTEIPQHIKFRIGDSVVTSGFSAIFPPDIPLGKIVGSRIVFGTHHEIRVKFFQDFKTLKYVDIVVCKDRHEIDSLITAGNEE
ncbi:MAG TPA: rod shape-determining protein MreC [Rikenellaceae bacterium]|nr:rod shape-determining protein MreC [Rikenellaceae bacterium]